MKKNYTFFSAENLGRGRVRISMVINFLLLAKLLLGVLAIAAVAGVLYGLYFILGAVFSFLWSIKFWLLGALLLGLLIWGLTKIKLPVREKKPRTEDTEEKKNFKKFFFWVGILTAFVAAMFLLTTKGCKNTPTPQPTEVVVTPTPVVTIERFQSPSDWIMLDCYLSEGFNIEYANYEKFAQYGKILSHKERIEAFNIEAFWADWSQVFPFFEGKEFNTNQLAALQRYGLWCGVAGFKQSPVCRKLNKGEKIVSSDLAKVYKSNGKERTYKYSKNLEHARKYSWILMNIFEGNLTIDFLLSCPVKSYEDLAIEEIYDQNGKMVFNSEIKNKLQRANGNKTTKEVLGL